MNTITKNIKSELMFRFYDYVGSFEILDALRPGMIHAEHVKSFLDMENRLLKCIDEAKSQYKAGGNADKNLYGVIV